MSPTSLSTSGRIGSPFSPPLFAPLKHSDYVDPLNLAKEDFGISVIIPRTLLDDGGGMEKNRLKALVQTIPSPG